MLAKVYSYALSGLEAYPITIEVDVSRGLPSTIIVGLPDTAIKESKERVRLAIKNSGYNFPKGRKTINLSPADTKKEGPSFDLAIAIGLLIASDQIDLPHIKEYILIGELSLDGRVKSVCGALSIALSMIKSPFSKLILPEENASEACLAGETEIYPIKSLESVLSLLCDRSQIKPYDEKYTKSSFCVSLEENLDFRDVQGQNYAKRGLEIAAAGGHNALLIGPPGSGKSMLSKRIPGILPEMTFEERLEITRIYSSCGLLDARKGIPTQRPFRSPHHTTSAAAIVGGGSHPKPGEITLSHNGILFLDELPEFSRIVLESLRQPLEDNVVTIARAKKALKFPANFMLVCAMNPCPCGFYTDKRKNCQCSLNQIQKYMMKISGPLLDRIDIHLEVPALAPQEILADKPTEASAQIKKRTVAARGKQQERFHGSTITTNARMTNSQIKKFCKTEKETEQILKLAIEELGLSARAYYKILKIARTIADLAEEEWICPEHVTEAIQYRSLDRSRWW